MLANEITFLLQIDFIIYYETIDMRDDVTHFSDLDGFSCFIQYDWRGGENAEIAYPSMPDGKRARTYMEETYHMILQIVKEMSQHRQCFKDYIIQIRNKKLRKGVL